MSLGRCGVSPCLGSTSVVVCQTGTPCRIVAEVTEMEHFQVDGGDEVTVTLDSGAGCSIWPSGVYAGKGSKLMPKRSNLKMVAANSKNHCLQ